MKQSGPHYLSRADEDRIITMAGPALLGVYYRRRENILAELHTAYYAKGDGYDEVVCKFVMNEDMIKEIERKLAQNK